ncbi:BA75_03156T0 [Komagataella pastoris]|uniref:Kinesin-like protein n=1 Tax=Komagataella pastoris TaxID=4922 RepID=A0A1B2JBJ4_PICPA|nr:BA75_03156T0 [Komagataella pastoris]
MESQDESITVVVRCRGRSSKEVQLKQPIIVDVPSEFDSDSVTRTVSVNTSHDSSLSSQITSTKSYTVDQSFGPAVDQEMVFQSVAEPLFEEFIRGYNCTIFAYGQTGTGKTHTMCGDGREIEGTLSPDAGIIPRLLFKLFDALNQRKIDFVVKCSFVELYNEELKDLLGNINNSKSRLRIYEQRDGSKPLIKIDGLEERHIQDAHQGMKLLQKGIRQRKTASTKLNEMSSRSHTIFTVTLWQKLSNDVDDKYSVAKMNLVDLAGSENIHRSGAVNVRAREAGVINQSLLTLGRVINSLVDKASYIPYRESKLTRLLQDSLGGKTKTVLIANISPTRADHHETISTLEYAAKAKNICNAVQVGGFVSKNLLLKDLASEITRLKLDLIATRSKEGVFLDDSNYNQLISEQENLKTEVRELQISNRALQLKLENTTNTLKKEKGYHSRIEQELTAYKESNITIQNSLKERNDQLIDISLLTNKIAQTTEKDFKQVKSFRELVARQLKHRTLQELQASLKHLMRKNNAKDITIDEDTGMLRVLLKDFESMLQNTLLGITEDVIEPSVNTKATVSELRSHLHDLGQLLRSHVDDNLNMISSLEQQTCSISRYIEKGMFRNKNQIVENCLSQLKTDIERETLKFQEAMFSKVRDSVSAATKTLATSETNEITKIYQSWIGSTSDAVMNRKSREDEFRKALKISEATTEQKLSRIDERTTKGAESLRKHQKNLLQKSYLLSSNGPVCRAVDQIDIKFNTVGNCRTHLHDKLHSVYEQLSQYTHQVNQVVNQNLNDESSRLEVERFLKSFKEVLKNSGLEEEFKMHHRETEASVGEIQQLSVRELNLDQDPDSSGSANSTTRVQVLTPRKNSLHTPGVGSSTPHGLKRPRSSEDKENTLLTSPKYPRVFGNEASLLENQEK